MDPCPFVRILVGNFAVKCPAASRPSFSGEVDPSGSPCFCRIQLRDLDSPYRYHYASVPVISLNAETYPHSIAACFDLSKHQMEKLLRASKNPVLKISVYRRRRTTSCAFDSAKLLGKISIPLDLAMVESRACMFQNGWIAIGAKNRPGSSSEQLLHLNVRAEPDPRFVFRFDGEPECSPQVFQIQGNVKQPVFTCKFSFRDRNVASRLSMLEPSNLKSWLPCPSLNSQKDHSAERKGWSITVHDLSGSPVAAASMITPFVPSPGSHRVSRSNPGAWLILRPGGDGTWKPWGRLEAWREQNSSNTVGYRFEILPAVAAPVMLAASTISSQRGGKFTIDVTSGVTPMNSPSGSWDLSSGSRSGSGSGSGSDFGLEQQLLYKGFVMSATVDGEGKCSKPEVEVGVQHVTCTEDAAAFVALAAAMDLSMDACKLFSQKLRKELRQ